MVTINYDFEMSKVYVADSTTKKLYVHSSKGPPFFLGIGFVLVLVFLVIPRISTFLEVEFEQQALSRDFRMLLILIGIVVGISIILIVVIIRKTKHTYTLDEYLAKHPEAKEVEDAEKALEKIKNLPYVVPIGMIIIIVFCISRFNRFLDYSDFQALTQGILIFWACSLMVSMFDNIIFALKFMEYHRKIESDE